jgi:hypothetical protein
MAAMVTTEVSRDLLLEREQQESFSIHLSCNGLIMHFNQSQSFGFVEPRYFSMDSFLCSGSRLQKHPHQSKYMIEKIAS